MMKKKQLFQKAFYKRRKTSQAGFFLSIILFDIKSQPLVSYHSVWSPLTQMNHDKCTLQGVPKYSIHLRAEDPLSEEWGGIKEVGPCIPIAIIWHL